MGRYRGIGMPRAKKKKVAVEEAVEEVEAEPPEVPEPPSPPSTPPKTTKVVKAESPTKSLLLKAQQRTQRLEKKVAKKTAETMERANALLQTEQRLFESRFKRLERLEQNTPKPSPSGQLQKAHAAEMALSKAYYNHLAARYDVASELVSLYEADVAAKDAKIVRLQRQLRVAKRAKKYRRGWSTTRVRFAV